MIISDKPSVPAPSPKPVTTPNTSSPTPAPQTSSQPNNVFSGTVTPAQAGGTSRALGCPDAPPASSPSLNPPATTLLSENTTDGQRNCLDAVGDWLDLAGPTLRGRAEVLILRDTRPGAEGATGHAVIRQGDSIFDPSTGQTYGNFQQFNAAGNYEIAHTVSGSQMHKILSTPPSSPERQAAIDAAKIPPGVQSMLLADNPPDLGPGTLDGTRAGQGGNPYNPTDEFEYALYSAFEQHGAQGAAAVQIAIDQIRNHQQPHVSTTVPQPGDVMVWGPGAGDVDGGNYLGSADQAGHVAVVENVTENLADGTVTIRISERNWDYEYDQQTAQGVPCRDITLKRNTDGTLSLPNGDPLPPGVGFVEVGPRDEVPITAANPSIGPNPPPTSDLGTQMHDTPPHRENDPYTGCIGYIHDIPRLGGYIVGLENPSDGDDYLAAKEIPGNTTQPQVGDLIVWGQNGGDANFGVSSGPDGHVAYIEALQPNYQPPGDSSGQIVSYTFTISEGNPRGVGSGVPGNNDRGLRTFTVPADSNGQPDAPDSVWFHHPAVGAAPSTSGGGATSNEPITGGTYVVRAGDTLSNIAARAGVTVDALVAANHLPNANFIREGQSLIIPR